MNMESSSNNYDQDLEDRILRIVGKTKKVETDHVFKTFTRRWKGVETD